MKQATPLRTPARPKYNEDSQAGIFLTSNTHRVGYVSLFIVITLILAILLVATSLGTSVAHPTLLVFLTFTVLIFLLLSTLCFKQLVRHKTCVEVIENRVSHANITKLHKALTTISAQSPPASIQNSGMLKTGTQAQTASRTQEHQFISAILSLLQGVDKKTVPVFVSLKIQEFIHRLQLCQDDPQSAYYYLNSPFAPYPAEIEKKFIIQFCVTALLFIGIIGTFHGLIIAFEGESIANLLKLVMENSDKEFRTQLIEILSGFHEAFGTSLLAYVTYLFGRTMLDAVDDDHDSLVDFVDERFKSVVSAFASLNVSMVIDLPDKTKFLMGDSADKISIAVEQQAQSLKRSDTMLSSYTTYMQKLVTAIGEARSNWKKASEIWLSTTDKFTNTAQNFSTDITNLFQAHTDSLEKFNNQFNQFAQEVNTLEQKINKHITQIQSYTENFDDTRQLIQQFARELAQANKDLQGQAQDLAKTERDSRHVYQQLTESMDKNHTEQLNGIMLFIQAQHTLMERTAANVDRFEQLLTERHTLDV